MIRNELWELFGFTVLRVQGEFLFQILDRSNLKGGFYGLRQGQGFLVIDAGFTGTLHGREDVAENDVRFHRFRSEGNSFLRFAESFR